MKLKEIENWKAVHFTGCCTYLPKDLKLMSKEQREILLDVEVAPMKTKGHYEVIKI